jgi:hypothetical protein
VYTICRTLTFPFNEYGQSRFMPKEWTDGLMTQPITTIV